MIVGISLALYLLNDQGHFIGWFYTCERLTISIIWCWVRNDERMERRGVFSAQPTQKTTDQILISGDLVDNWRHSSGIVLAIGAYCYSWLLCF